MNILIDYFTVTDENYETFDSDTDVCQTFTASKTYYFTSVKLYLGCTVSGDIITVELKAVDGNHRPTGSALAIGIASLPLDLTASTETEITFNTGYKVESGTEYALVITVDTVSPNEAYLRVGEGTNPVLYDDGKYGDNTGSGWTMYTDQDVDFKNYGRVWPNDIVTYRRLVAACNDEIWYEDIDMVAGDMVELTAANGDIDTSLQLQMFELYQKMFVVNEENLKVIDFLNTKIVDANGFTNKPSKGDLVHQNGTDPAIILVDYIDSSNNVLYGSVVLGTLETATKITTESGGAGDTIFPSPDSVTEGPHWYDWTVYDNDTTTYGNMPTKASLGCNYRGRAVLSGNPAYPYQWYMTRQGNPYDAEYSANDAQAPVAGNNADAGELGDIIRALIPYKDQYLIFGCANSIWYLAGDPAESGSIDLLDGTTGMYGAKSWCFGQDSLFFWGTGGIYESKLGENGPGLPKLLTAFSLPNIIKDEAVDPSTHRISMGYDRKRFGIVIAITVLATGVNSNYWYDLRTEGFFPESYPEECAAYDILYYDAKDPDYADLIIASRDGYLLKFDDSAKDDDIGASDEAISSNCVLPITKLSEQEDKEGKVTSMTIVTAGGASSGVFGDTDGVSYERHAGDDAETVLENIVDGDTAFDSGTLTGTGRKNRIRDRIRGMFLGLKLYNNTASQSWAIDEVQVDVKEAGRK